MNLSMASLRSNEKDLTIKTNYQRKTIQKNDFSIRKLNHDIKYIHESYIEAIDKFMDSLNSQGLKQTTFNRLIADIRKVSMRSNPLQESSVKETAEPRINGLSPLLVDSLKHFMSTIRSQEEPSPSVN